MSGVCRRFSDAVVEEVGGALLGVGDRVRLLLVGLFCEAHVLVEDVPGVGKTAVARAVAVACGLRFGRVQCTPDLLPSQVTGVNVFDDTSGEFDFRPGPLFCQFLLVDEINRATPRTQAALLEAMAERQVTVDGTTRSLARPFMVVATQNPLEHAGTFPLPEAQLDRFLLRVDMGSRSRDMDRRVLRRHRSEDPLGSVRQVGGPEDLEEVRREVAEVHVSEAVEDYLLDLCGAVDGHADVEVGISIRGTLMLERAGRAVAAMASRDHLLPDDLQQVAGAVLAHRLVLSTDAHLRGRDPNQVVSEAVETVAVPVAGDV